MLVNLEFRAMELWSKLSPDWRQEIERIGGVSWDSKGTDIIDKMILLETAIKYLREERDWQRKENLARESISQLVEGLSSIFKDFSRDLNETYTESARIIAGDIKGAIEEASRSYNESLEKIYMMISAVKEQPLNENRVNALAAHYGTSTKDFELSDCVYQVPEIKTPQRTVITAADEDGTIIQQCAISAYAQNRSFLGVHMFNAAELKRGGCPLYMSRGLIRRFLPHYRCRLADGYAHDLDIQIGKKTVWPLFQQTIDKKE